MTMKKHDCIKKKWPIIEAILKKIVAGVHLGSKNAVTPEEYMIGYTIIFEAATKCRNCSESYQWNYQNAMLDYLSAIMKPALEKRDGEILLKELSKQWNYYKTFRKCLYKMFRPLDEPSLNLEGLKKISRDAFCDRVYTIYSDKIRDSLLFEINRERNGEKIDQKLMKNVIKIYLKIGNGDRVYYERDFEKPMLDDAHEFYLKKALEWLIFCSSEDSPYEAYMHKVYSSLDDEEARVHSYMDKGSLNLLLKVVSDLLQKSHEGKITELQKQFLFREDLRRRCP